MPSHHEHSVIEALVLTENHHGINNKICCSYQKFRIYIGLRIWVKHTIVLPIMSMSFQMFEFDAQGNINEKSSLALCPCNVMEKNIRQWNFYMNSTHWFYKTFEDRGKNVIYPKCCTLWPTGYQVTIDQWLEGKETFCGEKIVLEIQLLFHLTLWNMKE